jgi:hypothetical protein
VASVFFLPALTVHSWWGVKRGVKCTLLFYSIVFIIDDQDFLLYSIYGALVFLRRLNCTLGSVGGPLSDKVIVILFYSFIHSAVEQIKAIADIADSMSRECAR